MPFKIYIDSTGDLPKDLRTQYNIEYFPMILLIDDKEVLASLDYDQGYSVKDLYDIMRGGKRIFTSQVPNNTYETAMRSDLEAGYDVLYIACSSALSASVKAAQLVAEKLLVEFPERQIICFDSLISGYGQGGMAIRASIMREEGKTINEVAAWLKENKMRFNQFATVATLTYLKQAGRVSATSAFFGNLFGVKPILISDRKGQNLAIAKEKGTKVALMSIAKRAVEAAEDIENSTVYIGHADDLAAAEFLKAEILKLAKPKDIYVGPLGPILGASTGPGTAVAYVFGAEKPKTEGE